MTDVLHGKIIRGYEILEVIGSGGFGVVYKAHQPVIDRDVAIKIIHAKYANQLEFTRRFELEARLIARLENQYIVPVYDFWRDPSGAYLVMRWLRGGNLRKLLHSHNRLPINFVLKVLFQLVTALDVAHQNGVVHRDIKPENIMFDEQQNMYLTDFGIAVDIIHMPEEVTLKALSLGSPIYMAPEQLARQETSPQADVYSVGILLYEMLTGETPFSGSTTEVIRRKHTAEPIPSLQTTRKDLPPMLDAVLWKATAHAPLARYATVTELFTDFSRALKAQVDFSVFQSSPLPQQRPQTPPSSDNKTLSLGQGTRILDHKPVEDWRPDDGGFETRPFETVIRNPFKGLRPFDELDAQDFFGRAEAINRLCNFFVEKDNRFLAVVGPSGSGKSSLVRAGFLSIVRQQSLPNSDHWLIGSMTPGSDPFQSLVEALMQVSFQTDKPQKIDLRQSPQELHRQLTTILPDDIDLFMLIDQFEEVFTIGGPEEDAQLFLSMLHHSLTHPQSRLRLILTLRADYYDRPLQNQQFGELIREHTEVVLPLSDLAFEEIIVEPGLLVGLTVEPELKAAILHDLSGQQGALPLLQHTLSELYENRKGSKTLLLEVYNALGGISGALSRRAEDIYAGLTPDEQNTAKQLFLRCVTIESDGEPTRKRVLMTELLLDLPSEQRQTLAEVLERFARHRLLTLDRDPVTRSPTIDIAHEALISAWSRLHGWINDNRDNLRRYYQLQMLTLSWLEADKDDSFLAAGARLAEFEQLLETPLIALNEAERTFITSGLALKRRGERRLRLAVVMLAVFSVFAVSLAAFALNQQQRALTAQTEAVTERDRANEVAQVARSRELAANTLSVLNRPDVALLLAYYASTTSDTFEARNSLLTALQTLPNLQAYAHGHQGGVRSVAYSQDGTWAASAGEDLTIHVWDTANWRPRTIINTQHSATINALAINGNTIFSASADGTIAQWDAENGQAVRAVFAEHDDIVWAIVLHPDGLTAVSGSVDGTLIFWDTATGEVIHNIPDAHSDAIYALAFSPNGALIASAGGDNAVRLWDAESGALLAENADVHTNWVSALDFSPSGRQLASSGADSQLVLWEVAGFNPQRVVALDDGIWIRGLAYGTSGEVLALAGLDGSLRLWDVINNQLVGQSFLAHQNSVWNVAASPRTDNFITAGADGVMIAWNFTPPYRPTNRAFITGNEAFAMALHPTQNRLAVALSSGQIQLWDLDAGTIATRLTNQQSALVAMAFSPSGDYISALDIDNRLMLWEVASGEIALQTTLQEPLIAPHLAFGRDDSTLFLAGDGVLLRIDITDEALSITRLPLAVESLSTFQLNADRTLLAVGGNTGEIILLRLEDLTLPPLRLTGHEGAVMALAFMEQSGLLVSASRDNTLIIWDYVQERPLFEPLRAHTDWVMDVAIAPDEHLMASAGRDQTIILWDLTTARPLGYPLQGHRNWVQALLFHPDGNRLYSAGLDGVIFEWGVSLADWQTLACQISNRELRADEWPRYFDEQPPLCASRNP